MEDFSSTKRKDLVTGGPLNALKFEFHIRWPEQNRNARNRANSDSPTAVPTAAR